jgi:hypothetical protein
MMSACSKALLSCLAVLATAGLALAQSPEAVPVSLVVKEGVPLPPPRPPQLRLHLAAGLAEGGPNGTMANWPGGSTVDSWCSTCPFTQVSPVLDLGADWSPTRYYGLGLRGRWVRGGDSYNLLGRHWDVLEVLLTPQLNLPWPWRWPRGGLRPYLALPIGPAWSFQSRAWSRAVAEEWHSRTGVSVGGALGFEFYVSRRWGFVVETSYQERTLSADVVETPVGEPQAQASERVTLMQRHLAFSVGLLVALDR